MIDPTWLEIAKLVGATLGAGGAAWLGQRAKAKHAAADAATTHAALERLEAEVTGIRASVTSVEARLKVVEERPSAAPLRVLHRH